MTAVAREILTASVKGPTPTTGLDRLFILFSSFVFFSLPLLGLLFILMQSQTPSRQPGHLIGKLSPSYLYFFGGL